MKKVLLLIFLFSLNSFSQKNGKIYFRNGTTFEGNVEMNSTTFGAVSKTEISYRPEVGIKITKGFSDIERVEWYSEENNEVPEVFYFKKLNSQELFIERISSNKNFDVFIAYYTVDNAPMPGFFNMSTGFTVQKEYYIGKKYSFKVEKLPRNTRRKKYKNIVLKYTSDCSKFSEKINNGFLLKNKDTRSHFVEYQKICN